MFFVLGSAGTHQQQKKIQNRMDMNIKTSFPSTFRPIQQTLCIYANTYCIVLFYHLLLAASISFTKNFLAALQFIHSFVLLFFLVLYIYHLEKGTHACLYQFEANVLLLLYENFICLLLFYRYIIMYIYSFIYTCVN
jgi:hypothetical protein